MTGPLLRQARCPGRRSYTGHWSVRCANADRQRSRFWADPLEHSLDR